MTATFGKVWRQSVALAAALAVLFMLGTIFAHTPQAQSQSSNTPITGWAWSDNVGWVSLNGSGYGLTFNTNSTVTGYAWNDVVGWIRFGGLSSFPSGSGTQSGNARFVGNQLTGWVRSCGVFASGCSGSLHPDRGGWDGWIYLGSTNQGGGVAATNDGTLSGYAYGDDNVGWLQFTGNVTPPCAAMCVSSTSVQTPWCQTTACTFACENAACTDVPAGCLSTQPLPVCDNTDTVRRGDTARLYWNINGATECSIGGQSLGTAVSGWTTPAIETQTRFTLWCDGIEVDTAIINIVPEYQEV